MSLSARFHGVIDRVSPLNRLTDRATQYLRSHPTVYKLALLVNHLFRAVAMMGLMMMLPFCWPVNMAICFLGSLFYRLTVENNCAYKFALPAFAGGVAFPMAQPALVACVSGRAFESLAMLSAVPLAAYLAYVILTVDYDVNRRLQSP